MNGVDDILKDIAENMKVFSQLKKEQMPDNLKGFKNLYWMMLETGNERNGLPKTPLEIVKHTNFIMEIGYKAGYMDALK